MIWRYWRYAMTYVLTALGAIVLIALATVIAGFNVGSSAVQLIPAIMAAMIEGQRFARTGAAEPDNGAMWRAAFGMTGISAALLVTWTYVQLVAAGLGGIPEAALVQVGVLAIIYVPANRWFYAMGFRAEAKKRGDQ